MARFVLGRLAQSAVVIWLAVSVVFVLLRLAPGDPLSGSLLDASTTASGREILRHQYALDRPLPVQYLRFVSDVLHGELGPSLSRGRPVLSVLRDVLPNSVLLMGTALVIGLLLGVALGAWQGANADRPLARASERFGLFLVAIPEYVVATFALTLFAATWRLFPIGGMEELGVHDSMALGERILDVLRHLALPALVLGGSIAVVIARYQRTEMLAVLAQPFVRTARAKGASESRVIVRHALRNALGPVITLGGLLLPSLAGGAVFVESIFAWPGMGRTMVDAVTGRDYPLAVGGVIATSVLVAIGGLAADIAAAYADPRLRRSRR